MSKVRFMAQGDVFVCDLEGNKGSEQGGRRLCVVVSNPTDCAFSPTVQIVPITSREKQYRATHHHLSQSDYPSFDRETNTVLCEQVRTIDKMRLGEKVCRLKEKDLYSVIDCVLKCFYGLKDNNNI